MATGELHKKFRKDRSSCSRDILADRQTHRQTTRSQCSAPVPGRSNKGLRPKDTKGVESEWYRAGYSTLCRMSHMYAGRQCHV